MKINGQNVEVIPVRLRRNKSWRKSVELAFRAGILWAPTTLYRAIRYPIAAVITGSFLTLFAISVWVLSRTMIVLAGLCGYVSAKE